MKIQNCSTWNNFKSRFFRVVVAALFPIAAVFAPTVSALAAPAVVPVGASLIAELLVALGVLSGTAAAGYTFTGDNPYVESIIAEQIDYVTGSGIPIAGATLEELHGTVIPENLYTTDGTSFFIGNKVVTSSDIFFAAKSLTQTSFSFPVNVYSVTDYTPYDYMGAAGSICPLSGLDWGNNNCYIPVYGYSGQMVYSPFCVSFSGVSDYVVYVLPSGQEKFRGSFAGWTDSHSERPKFTSNDRSFAFRVSDTASPDSMASSPYTINIRSILGDFVSDTVYSGSGFSYKRSTIFDDTTYQAYAITKGIPVTSVSGSAESLGNALVQVKPKKEEEEKPGGGGTPPVPQSPNTWEIWKSLEDLIKYIDTGEVTNGGSTYEEYVNNNYNYVDVIINVPDEIDTNVNLSGGLDINGSGDINININEDVSLPSAGDGSGFYNPSAVDVVGALSNNNPVISGIKGLFAAIDPALVGVFSVSVSLLLVLGLWKLIRG